MKEIIQLWKLYKLMIIGIISVLILCFGLNINNETMSISFNIIAFEIPLKDFTMDTVFWIKLIGSLVIIIGVLVLYSLKDYSVFFPTEMKMSVFLYEPDAHKIILEKFRIYEVDGLKISHDVDLMKSYFKSCDATISEFTNEHDFFEDFINNNSIIQCTGGTTFIMKKVGRGFQHYYITESKGKITHKKENRKSDRARIILCKFSKINSRNDDVFAPLNPFKSIILSPKFRQYLLTNAPAQERQFDNILYGVTKITIFPIPRYSDTVYLYKKDNQVIPVGYARYIES